MRHIFVVNPYAGKTDSTPVIQQKINNIGCSFDYEIYITKAAGDATRFVAQWCETNPDTDVRFYACGGDGTINEVVSGLMHVPEQHRRCLQMSCFPCGSGNDYVKYFEGDFQDIASLVNGIPHQVDVMRILNADNDEKYSINVCNVGFEAKVCKTMNDVKRKPIIGGERAYTTGVIKNLFCGMKNYCRLTVDGTSFYDGDMLLCSFSNGRYVGGGYQCAPLSVNDDGLIEVLLFKPIHIPFFARMISGYRNGKQFEDPRFKKVIRYSQAKNVTISSDKPFDLCIDGEMILGTHFKIQNLCKAVTFVSPLSN